MTCKMPHLKVWPAFAVMLGICLLPLSAWSEPLRSLPQITDSQEPMLVAVLELEAISVTPSEARGITERLRTWLIRTRTFTVIERGRMAEILEEQGFQGSGACDTDECVVQVGRVLGVRKMVAGSVSQVGNIFSLSIRLIDVESGRIETESFKDISGGIEEVLVQATQEVANELAARVRGETSEPPVGEPTAAAERGYLTVITDPPGATVLIDGTETGRTPLQQHALAEGTYTVEVRLAGHESQSRQVVVQTSAPANLDLRLERSGSARITLQNALTGSVLLIGGDTEQRTILGSPAHELDLTPGTYTIAVRAHGYTRWQREIELSDGDDLTFPLVHNPKSRFTAGLFSLVIPGTGQFYFGRPGRGIFALAAGAASIAYGLSSFDSYVVLRDDYNDLRADYAAATIYADLVGIKADLDETYTDLQSERDKLGTAVGLIGLVWFLNVIDAAILEPRARSIPGASNAPGPAVMPDFALTTRNGRLSLCLRVLLRP